MARLTIDGKPVEAHAGETILAACRRVNIPIPTLCYLEETGAINSCMVCLVEDTTSGLLFPACSSLADNHRAVETGNRRVKEARKAALDLLMAEHVGDCEAFCRRACPGFVDVPRVIRRLGRGDAAAAGGVFLKALPFPSILGRICPAPCERACRRCRLDTAISIRSFERGLGELEIGSPAPVSSNRLGKVAVVGSGPAGLSAAFYCLALGHGCVVYERDPEPGGSLRDGPGTETLPEVVLDREISRLISLGAEIRCRRNFGDDLKLKSLQDGYDAVILACGAGGTGYEEGSGTFVAGDMIRGRQTRLAARSMSEGRAAARAADRWLVGDGADGDQSGRLLGPEKRRFDSKIGRMIRDEIAAVAGATAGGGSGAAAGAAASAADSVSAEAERCLRCDCAAGGSCALRGLADDYGVQQRRFPVGERPAFERTGGRLPEPAGEGAFVSFEPGKCIKCGLCVALSGDAADEQGLAFTGRGFDVRVRVPFGDPLGAALGSAAAKCVAACPTGALTIERR